MVEISMNRRGTNNGLLSTYLKLRGDSVSQKSPIGSTRTFEKMSLKSGTIKGKDAKKAYEIGNNFLGSMRKQQTVNHAANQSTE